VTDLHSCVIEDARIDRRSADRTVGALRPGCHIGEGAHIGNFVEAKKTQMGKGSRRIT